MFIAQIKLWVLKELNEKESSGYTLIKKITELCGKKPSPGYIYPLLNGLLEKNFVTVKQKGRKKIYYITKQGKDFLKNLINNQKKTIRSLLKTIEPIIEKKEISKMNKFLKQISKTKDILIQDTDLFNDLRETILSIYLKNSKKNRNKTRKILKETIKKLKKLK